MCQTCFTDDPCETQEEHHTPDVEQARHEHALDPVHLVRLALRCSRLLL